MKLCVGVVQAGVVVATLLDGMGGERKGQEEETEGLLGFYEDILGCLLALAASVCLLIHFI